MLSRLVEKKMVVAVIYASSDESRALHFECLVERRTQVVAAFFVGLHPLLQSFMDGSGRLQVMDFTLYSVRSCMQVVMTDVHHDCVASCTEIRLPD